MKRFLLIAGCLLFLQLGNAQEQVRGLYGRQVEIFPPQVLDVADTFFSQEVPIEESNPGGRYIGVSAQGVRLSSAEIRVGEVLLSLLLSPGDTSRCRTEYTAVSSNLGVPVLINR